MSETDLESLCIENTDAVKFDKEFLELQNLQLTLSAGGCGEVIFG